MKTSPVEFATMLPPAHSDESFQKSRAEYTTANEFNAPIPPTTHHDETGSLFRRERIKARESKVTALIRSALLSFLLLGPLQQERTAYYQCSTILVKAVALWLMQEHSHYRVGL